MLCAAWAGHPDWLVTKSADDLSDLAQDGDGYAVSIQVPPFSEADAALVKPSYHRQAVHRFVEIPPRRWLRYPAATGAGVAFDDGS